MKRIKAAAVCLMAGVMFLTSGCVGKIIDKFTGKGKEYDSIVEKWQNETIFEGEASEDAINALLNAADANDHDEFAENFTEEVRERAGFDGAVNKFLAVYPKGLSKADLKYMGGGAGGSSRGDNLVKGATYSYECTLNGDWYHINVSFCFVNDQEPEKIGVEHFEIMNLNAEAYHTDLASDDPYYYEKFYLLCDIKSEEEMPARMIAGSPYLWKTTDNRKLTEDEMRDLLYQYGGDLGNRELREILGDSNAYYKSFNSTGYFHYYELQPKNGEPRYARICCQTTYGKIYDAYVCTRDDIIYDNPLYDD